jgi:hypothetical protein
MRAQLYSNGSEIPVNPFVERFVAAVCSGIASSLKAPRPQRSIALDLERDRVVLQVDSTPIVLDGHQGFAAILVRDTVRGMMSHLKGISGDAPARIVVSLEEPPCTE